MKNKAEIANTLLLCVFTCIALCLAAQALAYMHGNISCFNIPRFLLNLVIAYPASCLLGLTVPVEKFGMYVCRKLGLGKQSRQGVMTGVIMGLSINLIFTVALSALMTFVNVVILGRQGWMVFLLSLVRDFIPMWMTSTVVSAFVSNPVKQLTEKMINK